MHSVLCHLHVGGGCYSDASTIERYSHQTKRHKFQGASTCFEGYIQIAQCLMSADWQTNLAPSPARLAPGDLDPIAPGDLIRIAVS
jgi:hypothetical protein